MRKADNKILFYNPENNRGKFKNITTNTFSPDFNPSNP